jgi:predicted O-methyltransferase YrrM
MKTPISSIRPRQIFQLVEDKFPGTNVEITLTMPPSGIGSLLTLESALLVALLKLTDARFVFEIGTYNGNTALLLANNTPDDAVVTSLDLPPEEIEVQDEVNLDLQVANENDQFLRQVFKSTGPFYVNRASLAVKSKIRLLNENSLSFDPARHGLIGTQDLVFIDGGHDYETIRNDTAKAFKMAKPDSVILWHDYKSTIHTEVEDFLCDLSLEQDLIGIGSTMLCMCLLGRFSSLVNG